MPSYNVTDPSTGKTLLLTGDSPPTEQELNQIFGQFQTSSESPAQAEGPQLIEPFEKDILSPKAQQLPGMQQRELLDARTRQQQAGGQISDAPSRPVKIEQFREQLRRSDPALLETIEDMGGVDKVLVGAGQIFRVLGGALPGIDGVSDEDIEAFRSLQTLSPIATGVGQTLSFLPAGGAIGGISSPVARVSAGGALGAVEGGTVAAGRGASAGDIAKSAALGGAIGSAAERIFPPRTVTQVPEQAARDARAKIVRETIGEEPTRPQVTQSAREFQIQQEAQKGGGAIRDQLDRQVAATRKAVDDAAERTGGSTSTTQSTPINEVVNRSTLLDAQVTDAYRAAREAAPTAELVRPVEMRARLKSIKSQDALSGGVASALEGEARRLGLLDEVVGQTLTRGAQVKKFTVQQAESMRQFANSLFEGANPLGRKLIRDFKSSLDNDVEKGVGSDVFAPARQAKIDFEDQLSRAGVSKFDSRKQNLIRDMLENKVSPDNFAEKVLTQDKWRLADIRQLRSYLNQTPTGKQALADLKAEVFDLVKRRGFNANGELNGAAMIKVIDKVSGKAGQLLSSDEMKLLSNLKEVAKIRTPPRAEALGLGPSAQLVNRLTNRVPLIGLLVESLDEFRKARFILSAPKKLTNITVEERRALSAAISAATAAQAQEAQ